MSTVTLNASSRQVIGASHLEGQQTSSTDAKTNALVPPLPQALQEASASSPAAFEGERPHVVRILLPDLDHIELAQVKEGEEREVEPGEINQPREGEPDVASVNFWDQQPGLPEPGSPSEARNPEPLQQVGQENIPGDPVLIHQPAQPVPANNANNISNASLCWWVTKKVAIILFGLGFCAMIPALVYTRNN